MAAMLRLSKKFLKCGKRIVSLVHKLQTESVGARLCIMEVKEERTFLSFPRSRSSPLPSSPARPFTTLCNSAMICSFNSGSLLAICHSVLSQREVVKAHSCAYESVLRSPKRASRTFGVKEEWM